MKGQLKRLILDEEENLYSMFIRKTNDPQESRDLLQDLYASVLGNLDSFALADLLALPVTAEDDFFREALYEALYEAVEALPEKLGDVIREQALGERTFGELSREWGIPVGTLLSRKRKALKLLWEALGDFSDVWNEMNNDPGGTL